MGANQSSRRPVGTGRKTGPLLSSRRYKTSTNGFKNDGFPRRSSIGRSHSEKLTSGERAHEMSKEPDFISSAKRAMSVVDGVDVVAADTGGQRLNLKVPQSASLGFKPYQPQGMESWRMIDDDTFNMTGSMASSCEKLVDFKDCRETERRLSRQKFAISASVSCSEIDCNNLNQSITNFNIGDGKMMGIAFTESDNYVHPIFHVNGQVNGSLNKLTSLPQCCVCPEVSDSNQPLQCDLSFHHSSSTLRNEEIFPQQENAACVVSDINSVKQLNQLPKEPSHTSHDSGRASSVDPTGVTRPLSTVDGEDQCSVDCSIASDDLMLETEIDNTSFAGYDSHQSSFECAHYCRHRHLSGCGHQRRTSCQGSHIRRSSGAAMFQCGDFLCESGASSHHGSKYLAGCCKPDGELQCSDDHENRNSTSQEVDSSNAKYSSQQLGNVDKFSVDGLTYRRVIQDVMMFKTSLLKLKRLLQEDELQSPVTQNTSSEYGSCSSPTYRSSLNGLTLDHSAPSTPVLQFDFSSLLQDDTSALSELLLENADLKRQLKILQSQSDQQQVTISLLQQQMTMFLRAHDGVAAQRSNGP